MPNLPLTTAVTLLLTASFFAGCAHTSGSYDESQAEVDMVSGYYAGNWYGPIEGDTFLGEYTASTYKGTFKMYRSEKLE